MKKIILFTTLIVLFTIGCENSELKLKQQELNIKEKELAIKEKELRDQEINDSLLRNQMSYIPPAPTPAKIVEDSKYILTVFKTNEPQLVHIPGIRTDDFVSGIPSTTKEINMVTQKEFVYISDVLEVKNFNEQDKYKILDKDERGMQNKLSWGLTNFKIDVQMKVLTSHEEQDRLIEQAKAEILERKCIVFSTYQEASEYRNKNNGKF